MSKFEFQGKLPVVWDTEISTPIMTAVGWKPVHVSERDGSTGIFRASVDNVTETEIGDVRSGIESLGIKILDPAP